MLGVHGHGLGYAIPAETEEEAVNGDPAVKILTDKVDIHPHLWIDLFSTNPFMNILLACQNPEGDWERGRGQRGDFILG